MATPSESARLGDLKLEMVGDVTVAVAGVPFDALGMFLDALAAGRLAVLRLDSGRVVAASPGSLIAAEWEPN